MPITPGTRLGLYEVTALLGTGGMSALGQRIRRDDGGVRLRCHKDCSA